MQLAVTLSPKLALREVLLDDIIGNGAETPFRVRGEANIMKAARAIIGDMKNLPARRHQLYRPPRQPRGFGHQCRLHLGRGFLPEPAADIFGFHDNPFGRKIERLGKRRLDRVDILAAFIDRQLLLGPIRDGAEQLHGIMVLGGRLIGTLDDGGGIAEGRIHIARIEAFIGNALRAGAVHQWDERGFFINSRYGFGAFNRGLDRLRNHQRNRLPEKSDFRAKGREIADGKHAHHTGDFGCGRGIDFGDPALGNRGRHQHCVEHATQFHVGAILRPAKHLVTRIDTRDLREDFRRHQALLSAAMSSAAASVRVPSSIL